MAEEKRPFEEVVMPRSFQRLQELRETNTELRKKIMEIETERKRMRDRERSLQEENKELRGKIVEIELELEQELQEENDALRKKIKELDLKRQAESDLQRKNADLKRKIQELERARVTSRADDLLKAFDSDKSTDCQIPFLQDVDGTRQLRYKNDELSQFFGQSAREEMEKESKLPRFAKKDVESELQDSPAPSSATPEVDSVIPSPESKSEESPLVEDNERGAVSSKRVNRKGASSPRKIVRIVGNSIFYIGIVMLLLGALLVRSAQAGAPITIGGYTGMVVLSESMQDVIPKGSLILTKSVDPESLNVGDDITFMVSSSTSVTHRIIDITRQTDNRLAFETQGVNNQSPDIDLVLQDNIVGKVIYHNLPLGLVAKWISANWPLLIFLAVVWYTLNWVLKRILSSKSEEKESNNYIEEKQTDKEKQE